MEPSPSSPALSLAQATRRVRHWIDRAVATTSALDELPTPPRDVEEALVTWLAGVVQQLRGDRQPGRTAQVAVGAAKALGHLVPGHGPVRLAPREGRSLGRSWLVAHPLVLLDPWAALAAIGDAGEFCPVTWAEYSGVDPKAAEAFHAWWTDSKASRRARAAVEQLVAGEPRPRRVRS